MNLPSIAVENHLDLQRELRKSFHLAVVFITVLLIVSNLLVCQYRNENSFSLAFHQPLEIYLEYQEKTTKDLLYN